MSVDLLAFRCSYIFFFFFLLSPFCAAVNSTLNSLWQHNAIDSTPVLESSSWQHLWSVLGLLAFPLLARWSETCYWVITEIMDAPLTFYRCGFTASILGLLVHQRIDVMCAVWHWHLYFRYCQVCEYFMHVVQWYWWWVLCCIVHVVKLAIRDADQLWTFCLLTLLSVCWHKQRI